MRESADTDDAPSKGGASLLTFGIPDKNLKAAKAGPSDV